MLVPRTRDRIFTPPIFEKYQSNEKALVASMLEMYIQDVSTRKVSSIVEILCGHTVSKSFVSSLTSSLHEVVEEFLNQSLKKAYPFLFSDLIFIKVREASRVVSKVFYVVLGINEDGEREVLSFTIKGVESYESWKEIYTFLQSRGLSDVKLVISDSHKREVKAIKECFVGVSWQRRQVYFMRNIFDKLPKKNTEEVRQELKVLFKIIDIKQAQKKRDEIVDKYATLYMAMAKCLDEGFEDSFQYCSIEETNYSRLKSTNMLERVNEEIRRREKVV